MQRNIIVIYMLEYIYGKILIEEYFYLKIDDNKYLMF